MLLEKKEEEEKGSPRLRLMMAKDTIIFFQHRILCFFFMTYFDRLSDTPGASIQIFLDPASCLLQGCQLFHTLGCSSEKGAHRALFNNNNNNHGNLCNAFVGVCVFSLTVHRVDFQDSECLFVLSPGITNR